MLLELVEVVLLKRTMEEQVEHLQLVPCPLVAVLVERMDILHHALMGDLEKLVMQEQMVLPMGLVGLAA